ncbi:helix-turn-helix domain-containing protein [uncultured Winogradskyella sp.]|uniref:helix-turn-helix domain-containing protein n=1 Tax=uncultured Winogradskyella sp. TaxID=395353 RepID=UPI00260FF247|nr:helix-turn-helix domain-containing protein [uncultured Winogradskyella sp.]
MYWLRMTPLWLIHEKLVNYYNVDYLTPFKDSKKSESIYIRQLFHYLSRTLNKNHISLQSIGDYYSDVTGNKWSHATVMHSITKIEGYLQHDKTMIKEVNEIKKMFPSKLKNNN